MYLMLETKRVPLAMPEHCMTWTGDARDLFMMGVRPWKGVLQEPVLALQHFHHKSGADVTLYVAAHAWTDSKNRQGTLVSLYFATDAAIGREDIDSLGQPLQKQGSAWNSDGIHAAPEHAFPCLAIQNGELVHIWSEDDEGRNFTYGLVPKGGRARLEVIYFGDNVADRFWPHAKHAVGTWHRPPDAALQKKEQLKLAFAAKVAERVVQADGVVDAEERAFLDRTFSKEQLDALWLSDVAERDMLARQAEEKLANLLGYHEKLGLLSTFFAACYADGKVAVQELRVLREASAALGLENADVVKYLQRLW